MSDAVETALRFGPDNVLLGIMTLPVRPTPGAPTMLLFNAGIVHRIGPHRLNVKMARALATQGIASLRFDLSGLGDSAPPPGTVDFAEQATLDLQAAMDHLQATQGTQRFMLFGLCSGAVNGYRLALADSRVVGLLMFDGFVYPTWQTHLRRRWARLRTLPFAKLAGKVPQRLGRLFGRGEPAMPRNDLHLGTPSRAQFAQDIDTLLARGTSVYLAFSGSFLEGHNYHDQLKDGFGNAAFLKKIRYDYLPEIDHTATTLAAQRLLIGKLCDWAGTVR